MIIRSYVGTTPVLTEKERDNLVNKIMRSDGMDRTFSGRLNALKKASEKFGIKIKVSGKGTLDERHTLLTNHKNDEIVHDFKISFSKKHCSDQ